MHFEIGGTEYDVSAPNILQLFAVRRIWDAYYQGAPARNSLKDVESIVDVGACVGTMTLAFAAIWPNAKILAIEAHPKSFEYLGRNCQNVQNVEAMCIAAGNKRERIRLAIPSREQRPSYPKYKLPLNVGMCSRYGQSDDYFAEVEAAPLDEIVTGPVDFIKIDVEGSELSVLEGATETISKWHPFLMIEVSDENQQMAGASVPGLLTALCRMGYYTVSSFLGDPLFAHVDRPPYFR